MGKILQVEITFMDSGCPAFNDQRIKQHFIQ